MTLQWTEDDVDHRVTFVPELQVDLIERRFLITGSDPSVGDIEGEGRAGLWPGPASITMRFDGYELTGRVSITSTTTTLTTMRRGVTIGPATMTFGHGARLSALLRSMGRLW